MMKLDYWIHCTVLRKVQAYCFWTLKFEIEVLFETKDIKNFIDFSDV